MKLNKKGYMLVEIVIASVLAFTIAYYLLNLTYKFKDINSDVTESITYLNTKNIITKNIMDDLADGYILEDETLSNSLDNYNNCIEFNFCPYKVENEEDIECVLKRLELSKENGSTILKYGNFNNNKYNMDVSYYEKKIPSILIIENITKEAKNGILKITIPISSIYDENKYDIKLALDIDTNH